MNVVIVEDERPAAELLQRLLNEIDSGIAVVAVLDSVAGAVRWFKRNQSPDAAFLDIRLSDGISFDIFESVSVECPIVFTTAYDSYALRAFGVNSVDYLLKPLTKEAVADAVKKLQSWLRSGAPGAESKLDYAELARQIVQRKPSFRTRFLVYEADALLFFASDDVVHFTSEEKLTYANLKDGTKHRVPQSLEALEEELDPTKFFRANRQFILNITAISRVRTFFGGKLKIYLKGGGGEVLVSKERAPAFKAWLGS